MRTVPATVTAVCAALSLALTACAAQNTDPRALAGTNAGESLDKLLESYELTLPGCKVEELGFSGRPKEIDKHLLLRFEAPTDCVNGYLDAHGVDRTRANPWPFPEFSIDGKELSRTRPPFPDNAMEKFGLKLDPEKTYDLHTRFRTPTGARFTVLVVPRGDDGQEVYMVSTYNGED
ncbi:hypothetical protein JS756_02805 [Streptomyces actuosus]|uniref:Lipoprotein n=1 Tax=Streptomyces actuosus TaxID=1885 RepID=A0ABS2VIX8_STRAS|nr:hypothetical protein [Streptomyces actuosus]MBN0043059.1 hypothetical protein [Streptomyces actuosus]